MDMDRICKLLDCELDKIASKAELNDANLANLYKLVDIKKDLLEIEEKEMELGDMDSGNSNRYMPMYDTRGNSNRMSNYRRGGNSYRRGGTRYYNDNGYSMDSGDDIYSCLEDAMSKARTEQERQAIQQAMMKLDN